MITLADLCEGAQPTAQAEQNPVRVDWEATPESVMGPLTGVSVTTQEQLQSLQQQMHDAVGTGYVYIDLQNMMARLALMRSTAPGRWETELVEGEVAAQDELAAAIEESGGALNMSGHYPLSPELRERLRERVRELEESQRPAETYGQHSDEPDYDSMDPWEE